MDSRTESNPSTLLLAIAELDVAIARAREIAARVEAALHRSGTEAKPAIDELVDSLPAEPANDDQKCAASDTLRMSSAAR